MEALLAHQASVQDKLDAMNAWDLDSRLELAMDALRCPPGASTAADRLHCMTYRKLRRV